MCRYEGDGRWDRSSPHRQHVLLAGSSEPRWVVDGGPGVEPAAISEAPVPFIVGAGRSGATLLGLVLDHHPELAIPPETHFMRSLLDVSGEGEALRRACHDAMVHSQTWRDQHVSEVELWNAFAELPEFTVAQGLRAFYRLYRARLGKERWGERTPGHGLIMSGIQRLLPEARFVHVIRDGRDVALSPGVPGSGDDLASRAVHWMWSIREIRQQAQLCRKYLEVRHEELVLDTERCLRKICEFLELPYHPAMLDYHRSAAERLADIEDGVDGPGQAIGDEEARILHSGPASPPDGSGLFRRKREMSAEDRRSFEAVAGNMLKDLGY